MSTTDRGEVTALLAAWSEGDATALDRLTPLVYQELRRLARRYMAQERPGHTLQATALVNEAYVRLVDIHRMRWQSRAHFFAVSAQMMRRILVEFSRSRHRKKRGSGARRVDFDEALKSAVPPAADLLAVDQVLTKLSQIDARAGQVVEMRFFGGLSVEETAEVLKVSAETVMRDWKTAKVWLLHELKVGTDSMS